MTFRKSLLLASLAASLPVSAAMADPGAQPASVTQQFRQAIPNIPGKSLVAVVVSYPPGAKSAPHRHAGSAFIYAHVLSGAVRSQVNDEPVKVYQAGESWSEAPGAHHKLSENASASEPAKLLAVFVVDTNETKLTTPDHQ